jgi:hypothetical protein
MGHNTDLDPASKTGRGVVWLRTNATEVTTYIDLPPPSGHDHGHHPSAAQAAPSMSVDVLDTWTLERQGGTRGCAAAEAGGTRQSWKVVCSLPQRRKEVVAGSDRSDSSVLSSSLQPFALRFRAAKAQVLRSSHFSTRGRSSQS